MTTEPVRYRIPGKRERWTTFKPQQIAFRMPGRTGRWKGWRFRVVFTQRALVKFVARVVSKSGEYKVRDAEEGDSGWRS